MAAAPPPRPDDEVERRLAALKAGADPSSLGPVPGPRPPAGPGTSAGDRADDAPPALIGEVIDTGAATGSSGPGAPPAAGAPAGPGVRAVSWGISQAEAGRLGLWIGIGLVTFGGYLVLAEFVPGVATLGSLALAILGGVLLGWYVAGRAGAWALNGGAVLVGFGVARLVADVASLPSAGWGTLGAGLGLLVVAARRARRREGFGWQGWIGGALTVFGGWGALGTVIPGFPTLGDLVVPIALVLVGVVVVRRGFRSTPPPG